MQDGKPIPIGSFTQADGKELETYLSTKGSFAWAENVAPHYAWFNGTVKYTTADTMFDPSATVEVNSLRGSATDPEART